MYFLPLIFLCAEYFLLDPIRRHSDDRYVKKPRFVYLKTRKSRFFPVIDAINCQSALPREKDTMLKEESLDFDEIDLFLQIGKSF